MMFHLSLSAVGVEAGGLAHSLQPVGPTVTQQYLGEGPGSDRICGEGLFLLEAGVGAITLALDLPFMSWRRRLSGQAIMSPLL